MGRQARAARCSGCTQQAMQRQWELYRPAVSSRALGVTNKAVLREMLERRIRPLHAAAQRSAQRLGLDDAIPSTSSNGNGDPASTSTVQQQHQGLMHAGSGGVQAYMRWRGWSRRLHSLCSCSRGAWRTCRTRSCGAGAALPERAGVGLSCSVYLCDAVFCCLLLAVGMCVQRVVTCLGEVHAMYIR